MTDQPKSPLPPSLPSLDGAHHARHRSGAVAHMLGMPVTTLRVWERRYGLTQATSTPGGQRLYSADDVRRLALIKQLTDLGHAIGSLAPLDMSQLQGVASTRTQAATTRIERRPEGYAPPRQPWRLAVIGAALGSRLQRPALLRRLGRPVVLLGQFNDVAQAAAALQGSELDVLLIQESQLHEGWLSAIEAASPALAGVQKAVLYSYAAEPVCEALATAGAALLREPQPDVVVAQWLNGLALRAPGAPALEAEQRTPGDDAVPSRRWDDAALTDFANLSPTMACECPRHVAELLMQLSHFEAYSAECEHRNTADAELHAYLRRVAAASRARLEAALAQVALHEGLLLPAPANARHAARAQVARRTMAVTAAAPGPRLVAASETADPDSSAGV